MRQFGTYENNDEGTVCLADNDQWMAWMQWNENFYAKGVAPIEASLPSGGSHALFLAGTLGIRLAQRSFYRFVNEGMKQVADPFEVTIIQAPRGPDAKGWVASVDTHSASTSTKHPDEAFDLIYALADALFTHDVAETQGYLGGRVDRS